MVFVIRLDRLDKALLDQDSEDEVSEDEEDKKRAAKEQRRKDRRARTAAAAAAASPSSPGSAGSGINLYSKETQPGVYQTESQVMLKALRSGKDPKAVLSGKGSPIDNGKAGGSRGGEGMDGEGGGGASVDNRSASISQKGDSHDGYSASRSKGDDEDLQYGEREDLGDEDDEDDDDDDDTLTALGVSKVAMKKARKFRNSLSAASKTVSGEVRSYADATQTAQRMLAQLPAPTAAAKISSEVCTIS